METVLIFVGEEGSNIKEIKDILESYFGTRTITDMMEGYPSMKVREFLAADETFVNSIVASTNVTVFVVRGLEDNFQSKNILYLKSYDSEA